MTECVGESSAKHAVWSTTQGYSSRVRRSWKGRRPAQRRGGVPDAFIFRASAICEIVERSRRWHQRVPRSRRYAIL